jgi:hypothetical protein
MLPTEQELIQRAEDILNDEGKLRNANQSIEETFREFILPALRSSKDTLHTIYYKGFVRDRGGLFGGIRSKIQMKIVNTVISTIEKQSQKQQKFNELSYRSIELLVEELESIKAKK